MARTGTSVYPATLDAFDRIGTANYEDESGYDHVNVHNEVMDGIEHLEAVVGTTAGTSVLKNVLVGQFVATTAGTETLTNKTLTSPTINSPTFGGTPILDATSAIPFYTDDFYRQALINGNFDIWQAGTLFYGPSPYTSADRWANFTNGGGTTSSFTRQDGSGVEGAVYCIRAQRTAAGTATATINIFSRSMESINAKKLRGKKLTLSFWGRKGANYSAASDALVSVIRASDTAEEATVNSWTSEATIGTTTATLTTSWQKFTATTSAVVGSAVSNIGVTFTYTPVGTAGAADYFEIAQVQLCAGDMPLPFMPKSIDRELASCQRYYEKSYELSEAPGTADFTSSASAKGAIYTVVPTYSFEIQVPLKVPKRNTSYTLSTYSGTGVNSTNYIGQYGVVGSAALEMGFGGAGLHENHFMLFGGTVPTPRSCVAFGWTVNNEL